MKNMLKDALILFVITLLSGLLLGGVYQVTKDPIAEQQAKAKAEACRQVFTQAETFEAAEDFDAIAAAGLLAEGGYGEQAIDEVVTAKDSAGNALGYVLTVTTREGYGGNIQFTMGVTSDGVLNGISLLSIAETPGLGMQAEEVLVPQFAGKQAAQFSYTKTGAASAEQIDAISGATITTNAMVNGVNAGLYYFQNGLGGGKTNE